jgi:hypothetical protein
MTFKLFVDNLKTRWQEHRARRRDLRTGTGLNVPAQVDSWRQKDALERAQQELKARRRRI